MGKTKSRILKSQSFSMKINLQSCIVEPTLTRSKEEGLCYTLKKTHLQSSYISQFFINLLNTRFIFSTLTKFKIMFPDWEEINEQEF